MKIVRRLHDFPVERGRSVGFVPTMGAFHEGHLSLMRTSKAECGYCAASLFVNPLQFGPSEDYKKYPRQEEEDFAMAEAAGVDVMFAPSAEEMYPDSVVRLVVSGIGELWEGEHRPGHFDGVATVVAKLFHIVQPDVAYFGLKDFQQCAVIRKMVDDLSFRVRLRFLETVRESDGLALSSRNAYLSADERSRAPLLYTAILEAADSIGKGAPPEDATRAARERLAHSGFDVQYLECVDAETLRTSPDFNRPRRIIAAASLGRTRLIDNCPI